MAIGLELALVAIVAVGTAGLAAVWLIPKIQARRWREGGIDAEKAAELENSARGTIVQLVGGVALILTFVATWAQIADSRRASEKTLELAAQQQQGERFSRAIEQLGSSRLVNRVAAMGGLDAVIRGSVAADREPALQVILAYLRTAHRPRGAATYYTEVRHRDCSRQALTDAGDVRGNGPRLPDPDMQAAVSILVARGGLDERLHNLSQLDFTALDADGADFRGAHLSGAVLSFANLNRARFMDAELGDTRFYRSCLRGASFAGASGPGVLLIGADLTGADFSHADLSRANLESAGLENASLASADLESANLEGARLRGASLESADLRGAWLTGTDVTEEQIAAARTDECTRLPWRRHVSEEDCSYPGSVG